MQSSSRLAQDREHLAAEYLRVLQEFSSEIDVATRAITHNALDQLEESVRRQESLSVRLRESVAAISAGLERSGRLFDPADNSALDKQIRFAMKRFQQLNLRYAALLKHSSQSVSLMSSLCKTFGSELPPTPGTQVKHQTMSCEA